MKKIRTKTIELSEDTVKSLAGRTVELIGCGPGTTGDPKHFNGVTGLVYPGTQTFRGGLMIKLRVTTRKAENMCSDVIWLIEGDKVKIIK